MGPSCMYRLLLVPVEQKITIRIGDHYHTFSLRPCIVFVAVHVPICFVIALFFFISRCCDRKGIQKGKFLFQFRLDIRRSLVSGLPERGLIPEQRLVIEPNFSKLK